MAFGIDDAVTAVSTTIGKIIDRVFPDPEAAARAKTALLSAEIQAEIAKVQTDLSAILAEAGSTDRWTSRARPSFLYVMYLMILMAIPMGIAWAFHPAYAERIATGLKMWLTAIPEPLWELFGLGYLGYTGGRTIEKWKRLTK